MLLIGQGSTRSSRPDELLSRHAATLEGRGRFAEVGAAVLAGGPSLREALARIRARRVIIVPVFMCDGVLCREALPAALRAAGECRPDGHAFYMCPPVGMHPAIADLIVDRAEAALMKHALTPTAATLLVIGHGSTRDPASESAVALQTERIRATSKFHGVTTAFISQPPLLEDVLAGIKDPAIGVALFSARGNHVVEDIEKKFTRDKGRTLVFAGAIGEDDRIVDIIDHLAGEKISSFGYD